MIQFLSLATGLDHPEAAKSTLRLQVGNPDDGRWESGHPLNAVGHMVSVDVADTVLDRHTLHVVNWRTGDTVMVCVARTLMIML